MTLDTPTQLLDAAETLFAQHGYSGTSVRAIASLADANLAAVRYHFGSKAQLLAAVVRRVVDPITTAQSLGLDELEARSTEPSITDLVEAFVGPMFESARSNPRDDAAAARVIVMILTDPAEELRSWTGPAEDAVRRRYFAAFSRGVPDLSADELWFRMRAALSVVVVHRVELVSQASAVSRESADRSWAVSFISAAMSAPPTAGQPSLPTS